MPTRICDVPSGMRYLVPEELVDYLARCGGEPERSLIERAKEFCRPDGVFVDVGAHIGTYTLNLAPLVRETHAFEPQRDTFMRLCGGISLLGNESVYAHNEALGATHDFVDLKVTSTDGGLSSIVDLPTNKSPTRTEKVRVTLLDIYNLRDVCLMKIDVEGHELAVLKGAKETIARSWPVLLVEVWTDDWYAEERKKVIAFIEALGYSVKADEEFPHMLVCVHESQKQVPAPALERVASDSEQRTRLILTMIVKNETRVVKRLLDSSLAHVDAYAISDTGSMDGTPSLIASVAKGARVRGRVRRDEWKNFGHNRTESVALAREVAEALGWDLGNTYALLLDADMTLHWQVPGSRAEGLTAPAYDIVQKNSGLSYPNTRLVRLDMPWRSVGVTHEYWAAEGAALGELFSWAWIEDGNDGGNRGTKFQRDRELLEEGVRSEPNNERYMYYLAETYSALGEIDKAIEWFRLRVVAGGTHADETWHARFRLGQVLLQKGDPAGIEELMKAHVENPNRVEPPFYLAEHYRSRGENKLAMLWIERARATPKLDHGFMLETNIHDWRLDYEESIAGYYTKIPRAAVAADRVTRSRAPGVDHPRAFENLMHYTEPLGVIHKGTFQVSEELLTDSMGVRNESSSPTLARLDDGAFMVGIRLVNYEHAAGISFMSKAPDRVIRSREVMRRLGAGELLAATECISGDFSEIPQNIPGDWPMGAVVGLEDQRFVSYKGAIYFTANTWQLPGRPSPQMVLGKIENEAVTKLVPLRYEKAGPVEKNWLPFVHEGKLSVVYGYDPLVVLEVDEETGACEEIARHEMPWYSSRFRGSAGPVLGSLGRYWFLVHEVTAIEGQRIYGQRLLELSAKDFKPLRLSAPFYIDHRGVEYPLGFEELPLGFEEELEPVDVKYITVEGVRGIKYVITYGREERESCFVVVSGGELDRRLSP